MNTGDLRPKTAQIYAFPVRHRSVIDGRPRNGQVVGIRPVPFAGITSGTAWYHESAIQEADRTRRD